jgi:hypothetical protein
MRLGGFRHGVNPPLAENGTGLQSLPPAYWLPYVVAGSLPEMSKFPVNCPAFPGPTNGFRFR